MEDSKSVESEVSSKPVDTSFKIGVELSLHVGIGYNLSCVFLTQREYDRGVQDCDSALCVSEGSRRALYRKALCLREMGQLREAYTCGTKCLLTAPNVCHHLKQRLII